MKLYVYIFNVMHQEQLCWCGAIQIPNLLLLLCIVWPSYMFLYIVWLPYLFDILCSFHTYLTYCVAFIPVWYIV